MIDILDERLDEARLRFNAAQAKRNALKPAVVSAATGTRAQRLDADWATLKAKHGEMVEAPPAATSPSPGAQMRLAKKWAEELRLLRAGLAARQAHGGGPFEASAHKLEPYTTYS
jgi:hypothetical protein